MGRKESVSCPGPSSAGGLTHLLQDSMGPHPGETPPDILRVTGARSGRSCGMGCALDRWGRTPKA